MAHESSLDGNAVSLYDAGTEHRRRIAIHSGQQEMDGTSPKNSITADISTNLLFLAHSRGKDYSWIISGQ
jgi:hypothetical protein